MIVTINLSTFVVSSNVTLVIVVSSSSVTVMMIGGEFVVSDVQGGPPVGERLPILFSLVVDVIFLG